MLSRVLGRTNLEFPPLWLTLSAPREWERVPELVSAALSTGCPLDISSQPGLWGGHMRGTESVLLTFGGPYATAADESGARTLVQAHLLETLSCIGREYLDFYILKVRRALDEGVLNGILMALEDARREGLIRFVGLYPDGPALAAQGLWQFHDAFEVAVLPRNPVETDFYASLAPLARERRVGVLTSRPFSWGFGVDIGEFLEESDPPGFRGEMLARLQQEHPVLVGVRSPAEIHALAEAEVRLPDEVFEQQLQRLVRRWEDLQAWQGLLHHPLPEVRAGAERRLQAVER